MEMASASALASPPASMGVKVYKGVTTPQFLGDRVLALRWVSQAPELKWVGVGEVESFDFYVQEHGSRLMTWTQFTATKAHKEWTPFNINVLHVKTDETKRTQKVFLDVAS